MKSKENLKYISAVSVYNYNTDLLTTEVFRTPVEDWKFATHSHSEFKNDVDLNWLSDDYETAQRQLQSNDLLLEVVTINIKGI